MENFLQINQRFIIYVNVNLWNLKNIDVYGKTMENIGKYIHF